MKKRILAFIISKKPFIRKWVIKFIVKMFLTRRLKIAFIIIEWYETIFNELPHETICKIIREDGDEIKIQIMALEETGDFSSVDEKK